jgi:phthiocerol/phenolphthiocerol synthesis type-I polyketide synthase E
MRPSATAGDDSMRIAVVGMSGRFSGASNLEEYWSNLLQGVESVRTLCREEMLAWGEDPSLMDHPSYVPRHGTFEGIEWFDAGFFGYAPQDALLMDPQQRVFLECAWEAVENAGYDVRTHTGLVGVYAGLKNPTYPRLIEAQRHRFPGLDNYRLSVTNDPDSLAVRVSYKLGLTGPSLTVMTACSTSLVAIHLACQALIGGECDMALAGGVRLRIPRVGYLYREGGARSRDGRCKAFDADANGVVGGEGVGVVVLKLLSQAIADGDHIRAVVLGSAVNNDGPDRVGFTTPSVNGQACVIRMAHAAAQVDASSITYVETHGTATLIGDPVEVAGLTKAFRADTDARGFCAIGSVKSNIGHTDAAAGVAGFIKTVLCLERKLLPPSINVERPNPEIDFQSSPFFVNTRLRSWEADTGPLRAGVSSFGFGGTNAHAVLEEAPRPQPGGPSYPFQLLVLSARTPSALDAATRNLMSHLDAHPSQPLADVAYTLQIGREAMRNRRFAVCADDDDARAILSGRYPERLITSSGKPMGDPVIFMFPGQGAQHAGMARDLYHAVPSFREEVDECTAVLEDRAGVDLAAALDWGGDRGQGAQPLTETALVQPALFVIEYALARLWMRWGVQPAAMIGHSVGELVAATLAGVFSRDDALALVAARGRLMQAQPGGSMLAVPLPEADTRELLASELPASDLAIASVNAPAHCVVSGPAASIDAVAATLDQRGLRTRLLRTSHAFHSPMMEPAVPDFADHVRAAERQPPAIPYVSNLTGTWIEAGQAMDPEYWGQHIRHTVRFADGLDALLGGCADTGEGTAGASPPSLAGRTPAFLEVGPGRTLTDLVRRHPLVSKDRVVLSSLPHPKNAAAGLQVLFDTVGRLWLIGTPIAWPTLHEHRRLRVPLPTCPFERQRYLVEITPYSAPSSSSSPELPLIEPPEATYPQTLSDMESDRPASDIEKTVAVLFAEVLGVDGISRHDSFFELGGDSLIASQLVERLRDTFSAPLPLASVFEAPTVVGLARILASMISQPGSDEENDEQLGRLL